MDLGLLHFIGGWLFLIFYKAILMNVIKRRVCDYNWGLVEGMKRYRSYNFIKLLIMQGCKIHEHIDICKPRFEEYKPCQFFMDHKCQLNLVHFLAPLLSALES